jgi:peptide deformylase
MILSIIIYGHSVLRQKCQDINNIYPSVETLINNMWETLYSTNGVGLSASQVNVPIKLFIIDSEIAYIGIKDEDKPKFFEGDTGIKETFINANIIEYSEKTWYNEEGCLSIPSLYEEVKRSWSIKIEYFNADFEKQIKIFHGTTARIIQHEYDHTNGKLFVDYLSQLKRKLLSGKLMKISKKQIKTDYKII